MKIIRQIKDVEVFDDAWGFNKNEDELMTLDEFDREPGFYLNVIRPMLSPGHEGELLGWLKAIGILVESQRCKNATTSHTCNAPMVWTPARVIDQYQWKCPGCLQKRTIKDDSLFNDVKCNFKNIIRVLLGWCKGKDEQIMANILGIRKQIVKEIYVIAAKISEKYIYSHLSEFKIGGPDVVVVIDVYPDGFSLTNNQNHRTHSFCPILCFAEIKHVPTKFWLQALDAVSRDGSEHVASLKETCLKIVQQVIAPGSILVANVSSSICSYYSLQELKYLYPVIVSTDGLSRHDDQLRSLADILETVWEPVLTICNEAQYYSQESVNSFLLNFLWMQRFGGESLEMLLGHVSSF